MVTNGKAHGGLNVDLSARCENCEVGKTILVYQADKSEFICLSCLMAKRRELAFNIHDFLNKGLGYIL